MAYQGNIKLWKDISLGEAEDDQVRIECNWYDDEGEFQKLVDIRIVQPPQVIERGIFLSLNEWPQLVNEVDELIEEMRNRVVAFRAK